MMSKLRADSKSSCPKPTLAGKNQTDCALAVTHGELEPWAQNASEVRAKATAGGGRVLVVDDDADVRGVLDHMLRMKGYDVIVVASGEEAVAMYRTLSGVVDLVTLDLCMPGIDGYETFRQLRSIRADARVILCSGSPDSRRVERALADGAFGFIRKPFTASQVLTMVDAAIGHKADCTPSPQSARARSSNR